MYVDEIPYNISKELCRILDAKDWFDLGSTFMKFKICELNEIKKKSSTSPTEALLCKWAQMNHTVLELFALLYKMKQIPAMECLKSLVPTTHHYLIEKAKQTLSQAVPVSGGVNTNSGNTVIVKEHEKQTKKVSRNAPTSDNQSSSDSDNEDDLKMILPKGFVDKIMSIPTIRYEVLQKATDNWSEAHFIGCGGFGTVYKGEWLNLTVAIKRLKNKYLDKEFMSELSLNKYRHDNILPLYGFSIDGEHFCIIHQYMEGDSLAKRLACVNGHPLLDWKQRISIACGVVRGLQYLHSMKVPLIHGDIKPPNILLDSCSTPKIADFGLSRLGAKADENSHLKLEKKEGGGTLGYLPPEYIQERVLSAAVDVYSMGVVLFELATSLKVCADNRSNKYLRDHMHSLSDGIDLASLEDRRLVACGKSNPVSCRAMIAIGLACTAFDRKHRPTSAEVYHQLNTLTL